MQQSAGICQASTAQKPLSKSQRSSQNEQQQKGISYASVAMKDISASTLPARLHVKPRSVSIANGKESSRAEAKNGTDAAATDSSEPLCHSQGGADNTHGQASADPNVQTGNGSGESSSLGAEWTATQSGALEIDPRSNVSMVRAALNAQAPGDAFKMQQDLLHCFDSLTISQISKGEKSTSAEKDKRNNKGTFMAAVQSPSPTAASTAHALSDLEHHVSIAALAKGTLPEQRMNNARDSFEASIKNGSNERALGGPRTEYELASSPLSLSPLEASTLQLIQGGKTPSRGGNRLASSAAAFPQMQYNPNAVAYNPAIYSSNVISVQNGLLGVPVYDALGSAAAPFPHDQQSLLAMPEYIQQQQYDDNGKWPGSSAQSAINAGAGNHLDKKVILYKTEMCRTLEETGSCRYGLKCQFAHDARELRTVARHPRYKTEICNTFWQLGNCPYGKRCCFIHTENEMRKKGEAGAMNNTASAHSSSSAVGSKSSEKGAIVASLATDAVSAPSNNAVPLVAALRTADQAGQDAKSPLGTNAAGAIVTAMWPLSAASSDASNMAAIASAFNATFGSLPDPSMIPSAAAAAAVLSPSSLAAATVPSSTLMSPMSSAAFDYSNPSAAYYSSFSPKDPYESWQDSIRYRGAAGNSANFYHAAAAAHSASKEDEFWNPMMMKPLSSGGNSATNGNSHAYFGSTNASIFFPSNGNNNTTSYAEDGSGKAPAAAPFNMSSMLDVRYYQQPSNDGADNAAAQVQDSFGQLNQNDDRGDYLLPRDVLRFCDE